MIVVRSRSGATPLAIRGASLIAMIAILALATVSCGGDDRSASEPARWTPAADATWQWQLSAPDDDPPNIGYDVDVYDLDLVETPQTTIDALHYDGRRVICYFSAGSSEVRRDDDRFTDADQQQWSRADRGRHPFLPALAGQGGPSARAGHRAEEHLEPGRRPGRRVRLRRQRTVPSLRRVRRVGAVPRTGQAGFQRRVRRPGHGGRGRATARAHVRQAQAARTTTLILPLDLDDSYRIACPAAE
ncbi:endo alpha-1,4 polygalactosaminidase [Candidatus Microthrix sp.]|uniref:endo alpha-1,4 polygalactosaminidase n=1 Tax=Candidatus Neomicrothrix sp. TaxID=2719034 RepID=UPI002597822C|nr:endo alpha-1,4 polygalactosaminidase [Candidatus Microthrix sp.]HMS47040.1 endo alpha-1,4 polygalactosaminidase [Candidatus Microthrix sp.]